MVDDPPSLRPSSSGSYYLVIELFTPSIPSVTRVIDLGLISDVLQNVVSYGTKFHCG